MPHTASDGTLVLRGEVDLESERRLRALLSHMVGDTTSNPTVDLREVTFIDSTVLAVLVHAAEQLRQQGRRLTLQVADGPVPRLLNSAGLADRFRLIADP